MIDPTTNIGKLKLKVGDIQDIAILPDSVYTETLVDNNNNINRSAKVCAGYIAAILSQRTHERLNFIEIWGSEAYKNYMDYIKNVMSNPSMSGTAPIPYGFNEGTISPIIKFQNDWEASYQIPNADDVFDYTASTNGV